MGNSHPGISLISAFPGCRVSCGRRQFAGANPLAQQGGLGDPATLGLAGKLFRDGFRQTGIEGFRHASQVHYPCISVKPSAWPVADSKGLSLRENLLGR